MIPFLACLTFILGNNSVLDNVQSTSLKRFHEVSIMKLLLKTTKLRHREATLLASHPASVQSHLCLVSSSSQHNCFFVAVIAFPPSNEFPSELRQGWCNFP